MPNCRNCGARLNKWDNDVCPICGIKKPLDGVTSDTVEITRFDLQTDGLDLEKTKTRKQAIILTLTCGWTGAPLFYIKKPKQAILWLIINLLIIAGIGSLFLLTNMAPILGYVISLSIAYVVNAGYSLYFLFAQDLKDGNGEFLQ